MHILDTSGDQSVGTTFRAPLARSASATIKKRMIDLLHNILLKVQKSLKNQKTLCKNQKVIATHQSIATLEDPLILLSLSDDDFEDEAADEAPLSGEDLGDEDEDEDDDGAADGDEEDEDGEEEEGGEDYKEGRGSF